MTSIAHLSETWRCILCSAAVLVHRSGACEGYSRSGTEQCLQRTEAERKGWRKLREDSHFLCVCPACVPRMQERLRIGSAS